MSTKTSASSAGGAGYFKVGTYTGNGNPTQAITGIGFRPKFVHIWSQGVLISTVRVADVYKTDKDGIYAFAYTTAAQRDYTYDDDCIISLDADGFTVGDGSTFFNAYNIANENLMVYSYVVMG